MAYKREVDKVHRTIKKAGNNQILTFLEIGEPDRQTGETPPPIPHVMYFCQLRYTNEELKNDAIADGKTKLLVSPLGPDGKPIERFYELLKNKSSKVILPRTNGESIGIAQAIVTMPDSVTPILGRLFVEA